MVDTTDAWITERTGIKERHILKGEGLGSSHMGAEAVRGLLTKTGTKPEDVDLLICATTTPDFVHPCTANLICDMVGIRNIGSFDVQAACSGFIYALTVGQQFIAAGTYKKVDRRRRRQDVGHRRLHRPRHLRAVRRRRGGGDARTERRLRHHGYDFAFRRRRHETSASESRRQPHAADRRDRRQALALRLPRRRAGLQIRGSRHVGSDPRHHGAQQSHAST